MEKMLGLMEEPIEVQDSPDAAELEVKKGELELRWLFLHSFNHSFGRFFFFVVVF